MITVKQVFAKAFGEVPEGATCHLGLNLYDGEFEPFPCIRHNDDRIGDWLACWKPDLKLWQMVATIEECSPDIADRPAESFRGFFGNKYNAVLDQVTE